VYDRYKFLIGLKEIQAVGLLVGVSGEDVMRHESIINLFRYYVGLFYRRLDFRHSLVSGMRPFPRAPSPNSGW